MSCPRLGKECNEFMCGSSIDGICREGLKDYKVVTLLRRWLVKRLNDEVIVTIMKNKSDGTYSFINLTKEHICPCKFNSIDDALKDMNRLKDCGKIIDYFELK